MISDADCLRTNVTICDDLVSENVSGKMAGLKGLAPNLSRHLFSDSMEPHSLAIDSV